MTLLIPPPALAAVRSNPILDRQGALSLASQARRVRERTTTFIPPVELIRELDNAVQSSDSGLILIEGPPGVGTTSLLCYLAATRRYPFWLPDDDAGSGLEALCAQILALYDLPLALVP